MKRLFVAVIAVLAVSLLPMQAVAQGCTATCGTGLPPQSPGPRSYDEFVMQAVYGAYGREATCAERLIGYNALVNGANNGTLLAAAKRYVATRFMTTTSYNTADFTTYTQTSHYEARNPAAYYDRVSLESFVTDLYHAFLQRTPDTGGHCFWTNDACTMLRKHTIRAFEASIEFETLVNGLYDDGEPSCSLGGGGGGEEPCSGGGGGIGVLCP